MEERAIREREPEEISFEDEQQSVQQIGESGSAEAAGKLSHGRAQCWQAGGEEESVTEAVRQAGGNFAAQQQPPKGVERGMPPTPLVRRFLDKRGS